MSQSNSKFFASLFTFTVVFSHGSVERTLAISDHRLGEWIGDGVRIANVAMKN